MKNTDELQRITNDELARKEYIYLHNLAYDNDNKRRQGMKITMMGSSVKDSEAVELTIEYQGKTEWTLTVGKVEFTVSDLEKSMAFLKDDFNKAEKK